MKKTLFTMLCLFGIAAVHAQIGINTNYPRGILHIDTAGDNPQNLTTNLTAAQALNDVYIEQTTGNVGIGTVTPKAKLHVVTGGTSSTPKPGFILDDGSQGIRKTLTCQDATGLASWQIGTQVTQVLGDNPEGIIIDKFGDDKYTGRAITIPRGTWIIRYNITWTLLTPQKVLYIDVYLSTSNLSSNKQYAVPGSWTIKPIAVGQTYTSSQISVIREVTAASETLYLWAYYNGNPLPTGGAIKAYDPIPPHTKANILEAIKW